MAKISPVSSKYIIHATINITGVVDKPDVIGAIFGQTEGLLGADLELRELQRSGRIGRIEVNVDTRSGKTAGTITFPSSLDKAETSIAAAALEIIQRIGPCTAKIKVEKIEDVRVSKRKLVTDRAKQLLKNLMDDSMPDSQELADEVAYSVRVMEITEYGKDRLPAGPNVEDGDEIIVVEGRADVLNLLKHGFKNAVAIGGTGIPESLPELCKKKIVTAFVDGDKGGISIIKELLDTSEVDFVTKAPDGKEVEEITKKEIHKALRSKISAEQAKMDPSSLDSFYGSSGRSNNNGNNGNNKQYKQQPQQQKKQDNKMQQANRSKKQQNNNSHQKQQHQSQQLKLQEDEKNKVAAMMEDLIGTRGAYILDRELNILGKVPSSELISTINDLNTGIYAIALDGSVEKEHVGAAEKADIKFIIGMDRKVNSQKVVVLTAEEV
ncbi:MAG: DNA primase DnaG [Nanobdellota archaeon]